MKNFTLLIFITIFQINQILTVDIRRFKNSNLLINENNLTLITIDSLISFFALADWGGSGLPFVDETPAQVSSAYRMGILGANYQTKFQLGLGDNFYFYGVSSSSDKKFKETFEKVYNSDQLVNTPWFHTLGNHDHYGNAQAQIDYTLKSNRWILPNFNYSINVMTSNGEKKLITILMIDSIKLCGNTKFSVLSTLFHTANDGNLPSFVSSLDANMAALYFQDLENQLKAISASGVPYIIVGSHFPIFSVAEHGSTQCLIDKLMPLLHKYKVSLYLSGHDHNLQHISYTYLNSTVEYMVTGANSLNAISTANMNTVPVDSLKFRWPTKSKLDTFIGGFLMITASDQNMTVDFVKADGSFLYKKFILPHS